MASPVSVANDALMNIQCRCQTLQGELIDLLRRIERILDEYRFTPVEWRWHSTNPFGVGVNQEFQQEIVGQQNSLRVKAEILSEISKEVTSAALKTTCSG